MFLFFIRPATLSEELHAMMKTTNILLVFILLICVYRFFLFSRYSYR